MTTLSNPLVDWRRWGRGAVNFVLAFGLGGTVAFGANTQATINVQCSVNKRVAVSVDNATASIGALSDGTDGAFTVNVTERCNADTGYTVSLQAQDGGGSDETAAAFYLTQNPVTSDQMICKLTYNSVDKSALSSGTVNLTDVTAKNVNGAAKALIITVPYSGTHANLDVPPGTYSGKLVLTIAAK